MDISEKRFDEQEQELTSLRAENAVLKETVQLLKVERNAAIADELEKILMGAEVVEYLWSDMQSKIAELRRTT